MPYFGDATPVPVAGCCCIVAVVAVVTVVAGTVVETRHALSLRIRIREQWERVGFVAIAILYRAACRSGVCNAPVSDPAQQGLKGGVVVVKNGVWGI
jgi:hypothetical protein